MIIFKIEIMKLTFLQNFSALSVEIPGPEFVLEEIILCVKRVFHLAQLFGSSDHVRNHYVHFRPRQIFVHSEVVFLCLEGEMVSQSQKLRVAHSYFAVR